MILHPEATKRAEKTFKGLEQYYNKIHDNKYDYSKSVYKNSKTKMIIICPIHGEFEQCHNKHGTTKQGCPKCGGRVKSTTEEFTLKAKEIHGEFYDYSKVDYTNQYNDVTIVCPKHGEFRQSPTNHLAGKKCRKCAYDTNGIGLRRTFEEFTKKANEVHSNRYSYKNYSKASNYVTIVCPTHGEFQQQGTSHLLGCGCPSCATYGFDSTKPGILYYLSINNGQAYKIGITNRTLNERFNITDLNSIKILKTWHYEDGTKCRAKETEIKRTYKEHRYEGPDLLSSGNSELFIKDILRLDKEIDKNDTLSN